MNRYLAIVPLLIGLGVPIARADLAAGIDAVERRDFAAAVKQFRPLAKEGDVAAQVNLGNLYLKGLGVTQNYKEALRWFRLAADQNEPMAWAKLGIMHFYGFGVEKNASEAAEWFRKAAERGDVASQIVLASLYGQGDGVKKDDVLAYYWYSRAVDRGSEDALAGRDSLEEEIKPGDKDEALRLLAEARKQDEDRDEKALEAATGSKTKVEMGGEEVSPGETNASKPESHKASHRKKRPDQKRHRAAKTVNRSGRSHRK